MMNITFYWKNRWNGELETVEVEFYNSDRTKVYVKRFDGCIIGFPVEELIVVTDIDKREIVGTENGFIVKDANDNVVHTYDRYAAFDKLASQVDMKAILDRAING